MRPRVLIIEDDSATAAFLAATLADAADARVARSLHDANLALATTRFDAWLVDLGLPDGDGATWLQERREAGQDAPALAMSADLDPSRHASLKAAGFADALAKPCAAARLQRCLQGMVPALARPWNDAAGLAATGQSADILSRLRALFLAELPGQVAAITLALDAGDIATALSILHRLRSGCGMVGAEALAASVANLQRRPDDVDYRARFVAEVATVQDRGLNETNGPAPTR